MSLILEALKKSEDKRRLGAAPDLATPFSAPRRRSWVWPIAALLVVAGVVAWALRPATPPKAPAETATAPKKAAPVANAAPTPGQKTGTPLHSVTGNNDVTQTAPPPNLHKPEPQPSASTGKFAFGQPTPGAPATPVVEDQRAMREQARERRRAEQGKRSGILNNSPPPAAVANAKTLPPKTPAVVPPPMPVKSASSAAPAAEQSASVAPPAPRVSSTAPAKATAPAADATPTRAPKSAATVGLTPPPAAKPATPAASSAQPYSELPFSVRKSLPELKVSMHVYSADPSHRFVVLNDARLTEGEKTTDEIFVREIRPDGIVLEFQSQRFFYPRDGL